MALVFVFRRFKGRSLYRPTCTALSYVFLASAALSVVRTLALIDGDHALTAYVDIAVSGVVLVAAHAIWRDTTRDA